LKRKTGLRHPEFQSSCSWTLAICLATLFFVLGANVVMLGQTGGVIYRFKGGSDGTNPYATLVADKAGNLYGTTAFGGSSPNCIYGCGTVFELTCRDRQLTETVLYTFTNESLGGRPYGGLALDQAGNIYGTTTTGGAKGYGTVFQLRRPASAGDAWNSHVLHDLTAFNNGYPIYPILDKSGTVYFEEPGGGEMGTGAVSQLSPPTLAGGAWTYTQIHSFVKSSDGFLPIGTLTFDRLGNLYGVTANGGNTTQCNSYGCGIVFELVRPSTNGGSWSEKIVYRFQPVPDANHPYSGVIFDNSGNMFGTTQQGGVNGAIYGGFGTVYEGLQKIGINGDHDVLITGLGPVGLATGALTSALGAWLLDLQRRTATWRRAAYDPAPARIRAGALGIDEVPAA